MGSWPPTTSTGSGGSGPATAAFADARLASLGSALPVARTLFQVGNVWQRCRADDLVAAGGTNGSSVSSWTDTSGGSRAIVQATGADQPTLTTGQQNGRACVRFAAGQFMALTAALAVPYTIFVVAYVPRQALGAGVNQFVFTVNGPLALFLPSAAVAGPLSLLNAYGSGIANIPCGAGTLAVYTISATATGTSLWRNGVPIASNAPRAASAISLITLGADSSETLVSYAGDIYEWDVVSGTLFDLDRRSIEQDICNYYGLEWGTAPTFPTFATPSVGGVASAIWTPPTFDKNQPTPLLIVSHGSAGSGNENVIVTDDFVACVDAALAMGFIVAASHEATPGDATSIADCLALYNYLLANVAPTISATVAAGVSLGGVTSLLNVSRLPNVVGWLGVAPVCDTVAWGGLSAVANPITEPLADFTGKRFRFYASASDPTVPIAANSTAMQTYIASVAEESAIVLGSGLHIDPSQYQPLDVAQFLARCLGG